MEKVHGEHVHSATLVNATEASAVDDSFLLGPSHQNRFVVMATTSHESKGHHSRASFGEEARVERKGA